MSTTNIYGIIPLKKTRDDIINSIDSNDVFGVRYPLYDSANERKGIFSKTKGIELLKSQLIQFIKTERGERVMLPNFGLSLRRYLFEPITEDLIINLKKEVINGLALYVPRATVLKLDVFQGDALDGFGVPGIKIHLVVSDSTTNQQTDLTVSL
tara:strand:- start:230 stop:691 length:462 start_codon:yes stop_codon:yes gene_type:complete